MDFGFDNIFIESFPKLLHTKILIHKILTNRSILIHHKFVWNSFVLSWTVNFETCSIRFKLVLEEMNLKTWYLYLFVSIIIMIIWDFTMTGVDLYLSKLRLILITILSLLVLLMINTCWWILQLLKMNWSITFDFPRSSVSIHLQEV